MNDATLHEAIAQLVPACDGATGDWEDVLRRAGVTRATAVAHGTATRDNRRRWLRRPLPRRALVGAIAASVAVLGAASGLAYHYLGPSPGFTAGISAFDRLPPLAAPPPSIPSVGLDRAAVYAGLTPTEAAQRLRLLQSGLTQGDLYAFEGENGTVCVFLTRHFGQCLNGSNARATAAQPGVLATISPGYPNETPAVVAIVADNVSSVAVVVDGNARDVPIVNNSVYADLNGLKTGDRIALDVRYADNSTKTFPLVNPKTGP